MILSGVGEQQVDVAVSRLKDKFGVEAKLDAPKVAYRETITKKVSAQGRHKKQSGGHGQFGDVFIEFEPYDTEKLILPKELSAVQYLKTSSRQLKRDLMNVWKRHTCRLPDGWY